MLSENVADIKLKLIVVLVKTKIMMSTIQHLNFKDLTMKNAIDKNSINCTR